MTLKLVLRIELFDIHMLYIEIYDVGGVENGT